MAKQTETFERWAVLFNSEKLEESGFCYDGGSMVCPPKLHPDKRHAQVAAQGYRDNCVVGYEYTVVRVRVTVDETETGGE